MYTLSDRSQFQALAIMQGKHTLSIVHLEIIDRISKQFGVNALDFSCETRGTSDDSPQQIVHLILETVDDVKKMQANRAGTAMIIEQFLTYFKSIDLERDKSDLLKSNVFPPERYQINPLPEVIITYRALTGLSGEILKEMRSDEKFAILKTFESVWTMSLHVVFYFTDAQIKENLANGLSAKITTALEAVDRKYDFKTSYPYTFDSKEYFDRDHESKWHSYWK